MSTYMDITRGHECIQKRGFATVGDHGDQKCVDVVAITINIVYMVGARGHFMTLF